MSGVNPRGRQVFSFKHPSPMELLHDFLWRATRDLPERGRIGIFNRSYYEEVLIVRAHRDILLSERLRRAGRRQSPLARPFIGRSRIWKGISMPTAPASSNSSFISRRRSSEAFPRPHRRAQKEPEIQHRRRRRTQILEALYEGLRGMLERDEHGRFPLVSRARRRQRECAIDRVPNCLGTQTNSRCHTRT